MSGSLAAALERDGISRLFLQREVEDFFALEAECLDERRFDDWLEMLSEDIRYFMPMARNVSFEDVANEYTREQSDANWFDDGKAELRSRVAQIQSGDHWAEEPRSRTTHFVAGVRVADADAETITVKSRFVVCQNRLASDIDVFIGKRVDRLVRHQQSFLVAHRTIVLDQNVLLSKYLTTFF